MTPAIMRAQLGDFRGLPGVLLHLLSQLKERLGLKSSKVCPAGCACKPGCYIFQ